MNQKNYASIFEALCKIPAMQDKTPSEVAMTAKELADEGCIVDHEGDIINTNGEVYWPEDISDGRRLQIGFTDEDFMED